MLGSFFVGGMAMRRLWMGLAGCVVALAMVIGGRAFGADEKLSETGVSVNPAFLSLGRGALIDVSVDDGVTDGCWTNVAAVKTAVELELQRSGFDIPEKSDNGLIVMEFKVLLETSGFSLTSNNNENLGCVGHYIFSVESAGQGEFIFNSNGHHLVYNDDNILWMESVLVASSNLNKPFMDGFINLTKRFLVDVKKNRKKIISQAKEKAGIARISLKDVLENKSLNIDEQAQLYWSAYKLD